MPDETNAKILTA